MTTAYHTSSPGSSAVLELQTKWTSHQQMMSCLEHIRDTGDGDFLLLRSVLELMSPGPVVVSPPPPPPTSAGKNTTGPLFPHHHHHPQSLHRIENLPPSQQELLFHCITGCRHVMLTRWEVFSSTFRDTVRDLFMGFGGTVVTSAGSTSSSSSSLKPIQMAFFTTSVAFWKRNWDVDRSEEEEEEKDEGGNSNSNIHQTSSTSPSPKESYIFSIIQQQFGGCFVQLNGFNHLLQFLSSTNTGEVLSTTSSSLNNQFLAPNQQSAATATAAATSIRMMDMQTSCMFLSVLVGEFSGQSTAVSYRLPIEFHQKVHRSFETNYLEGCLKIVMMALSNVVSAVRVQSGNGKSKEVSVVDDDDDDHELTDIATPIAKAAIDVLSWEFGASAWLHLTSRTTLIRPPPSWAQYIIQPDFVGAIFEFHNMQIQQCSYRPLLAHHLRQLILLLSSVSGPIFRDKNQKKAFVQFLWQGARQLISIIPNLPLNDLDDSNNASGLVLDAYTLIVRLLQNFNLQQVYDLPCFAPALQSIRISGTSLMVAIMQYHERHDVTEEYFDDFDDDWRQEALDVLWESIVLMCQDPWLCDERGDPEPRNCTKAVLNEHLSQLYAQFVQTYGRIEFLRGHRSGHIGQRLNYDHDDDDEAIDEAQARSVKLQDGIKSISCLGKLNTMLSLAVVGAAFQTKAPQLLEVWERKSSDVEPSYFGNVQETRFLIQCIGVLLTDSGSKIPASIIYECEQNNATIEIIAGAIQAVFTLIQAYASRSQSVGRSQEDLSLSLSSTFFWFMKQWIPTYVYSDRSKNSGKNICTFWSQSETANQVVDFCCWLCVHCLGNPSGLSSNSPAELIVVLAQQNTEMRMSLKKSVWFQNIYFFQCISYSTQNKQEAETQIRNIGLSPDCFDQFCALPASSKSDFLTGTLVAVSDPDHDTVKLLNDLLHSVSMVESTNAQSTELMMLCVSILHGIVMAVPHISEPERLIAFLCFYIDTLAGKMQLFAHDLNMCKNTLNLFCDLYHAISNVKLDDNQTSSLLTGVATLLSSYSDHHCRERQICPPRTNQEAGSQDEKAYEDISTALLLLTKILDVRTEKAFELAFVCLQKLLPLLTGGLLQYPQVSSNYFSLISALVDRCTYLIPSLPVDLLNIMLNSLERGAAHEDIKIAKTSLASLEKLFKAHLLSGIFAQQLHSQPDLLAGATTTIVQMIYQPVVFERIEEVSGVLLSLLALDAAKLVAVMEKVARQSKCYDQSRFRKTLEPLVRQDLITNVLETGYEGRQCRKEFGEVTKRFSNEMQAFLVLQ
mmetsp:Transcript_27970/g.67866  ORF Transcript_27970/g.67866 Transcript_27970/m.67866 type:complete len:1289 (-) Transcript_27970:2541-6407(-)|eukprot:CAMPEP_0113520220 /NCGR_PEP_ID=MMETSP0014_2-20120614/43954_1 /TAXON_ID=2857 /ORGANISM="Nitzschia sp." /LENGTH=1288 /DNA_ID=CAMNT_0000418025 /DNA_START=147 /DNA_END=4013 /DNA_ORIENTATION=- /assembly_acc=CAM_ASM_000159